MSLFPRPVQDGASYEFDKSRREARYVVRWTRDPRKLDLGGYNGVVLASVAALWCESGKFVVTHVAEGVRIAGVDRINAKEWLALAPQNVRDLVFGPIPEAAAA